LNPRPKRFDEEDYILSLFMNLLSCHQKTGQQEKAYSDIPLTLKARINGFQPYMTPGPELGWPPRQT